MDICIHLPWVIKNSKFLGKNHFILLSFPSPNCAQNHAQPSLEAGCLGRVWRFMTSVLYWKGEETHVTTFWTGTSQVIQWLRHLASTAGGMGSIPGWGTEIPHAVSCGQNPWTLLKWLLRRSFELALEMPCTKLRDTTLPLSISPSLFAQYKNTPCLSKQVDCVQMFWEM